MIGRFTDNDKSLTHLFGNCEFSLKFWKDLEDYLKDICYSKQLKNTDIVVYFDCYPSFPNVMINLILLGKFHIQNLPPVFELV